MFRFGAIYYLLLFAVLPLVFYGIRRLHQQGLASFQFSDTGLFSHYPLSLKVRLAQIRPYFVLLPLALMIIALARPQFGTRSIDILSYGVDIISVLDISGTMAAEDFKPHNRIQTAKDVLTDFIKGRPNDRIGLIIFAGRPYTQVPLTLDHAILETFLEEVQLGMVEDGTAIGMAIASGVNRLRHSTAKSRVMILLTDGDNNAGEIDPITAAKLAKNFNVKIYTIGVGKRGGAPIPFVHPLYGKSYYTNPDGSLVLTKMDENTLTQIASVTGGRYFRATDTQTLREIYRKIDGLEKSRMNVKEFDNYAELANYFMIPALLVLLLDLLVGLTWLRRVP